MVKNIKVLFRIYVICEWTPKDKNNEGLVIEMDYENNCNLTCVSASSEYNLLFAS